MKAVSQVIAAYLLFIAISLNAQETQLDGRHLPDAIRAELDLPYTGTENPRQRLDL
jgi:hypothetical protein